MLSDLRINGRRRYTSMTDVFISYTSKDEKRVQLLHAALARTLKVTWMRDFLAGPHWRDKVPEAIDMASCTVVVWSKRSVSNPNVRAEAQRAFELGRLVPIRIEVCEPPYPFEEATYLDFIQPEFLEESAAWPRLLSSIEAMAKRRHANHPEAPLQESKAQLRTGLLPLNAYLAYLDRTGEAQQLVTQLAAAPSTAPRVVTALAVGRQADWPHGLAVRFQWQDKLNAIALERIPKVIWPSGAATGVDERSRALENMALSQLRRVDGLPLPTPPNIVLQNVFRRRYRIVVHYEISTSSWMRADGDVAKQHVDWWRRLAAAFEATSAVTAGAGPAQRAQAAEIVLLFSIIQGAEQSRLSVVKQLFKRETPVREALANSVREMLLLHDARGLQEIAEADLPQWQEELERELNVSPRAGHALRTAAGNVLASAGRGWSTRVASLPIVHLKERLMQDATVHPHVQMD